MHDCKRVISHSLLDKEINEVIAIFNVNNCVNADSPKTSSVSSSRLDDLLSRRSIEDVLWLFSS